MPHQTQNEISSRFGHGAKGALGYEVARKARDLENPEERRTLYFLQKRASEKYGLKKVALELLNKYPGNLGTATMHQFGLQQGRAYPPQVRKEIASELGLGGLEEITGFSDLERKVYNGELPLARYNEIVEERSLPGERTSDEFRSLCRACSEGLPGTLLELIKRPLETRNWSLPYFRNFRESLLDYVKNYRSERLKNIVATSIGKRIYEALDYARMVGGITLIEGPARIGKTFAAQAWCDANPDKSRYVQLEADSSETAFYQDMTRALGNGYPLGNTSAVLKDRVKELFHEGDLLLVLDEAHWLWGNNAKAVPRRLNWLMTALVNHGVPVALITTRQFIRSQKAVEENTGWTSEQFVGRISEYVKLPSAVSENDLKAVAEYYLPEGDPRSIKALVSYAQTAQGHLQAIKKCVDKARHIAEKRHDEFISFEHFKVAISEVITLDSALSTALDPIRKKRRKGPSLRPPCKGIATPLRRRGRPLATPFRSNETLKKFTSRPPVEDREFNPALKSESVPTGA